MKKQLSDEQIDNLMRTMVSDASLDDAAINEIADSPTLWWAVQREINVQKVVSSPWPPALRRWLMIGVPVLAALALVTIFVFRPTGETTERAGLQQNVTTPPVGTPEPIVIEPATPANNILQPTLASLNSTNSRIERKIVVAKATVQKKPSPTIPSQLIANKTEIKSDFISLSYARNPESGQVVRVKVPSSMMVTLGLVASVEKPSNLVDAEVVVGDDGTTHAIRFIR